MVDIKPFSEILADAVLLAGKFPEIKKSLKKSPLSEQMISVLSLLYEEVSPIYENWSYQHLKRYKGREDFDAHVNSILSDTISRKLLLLMFLEDRALHKAWTDKLLLLCSGKITKVTFSADSLECTIFYDIVKNTPEVDAYYFAINSDSKLSNRMPKEGQSIFSSYNRIYMCDLKDKIYGKVLVSDMLDQYKRVLESGLKENTLILPEIPGFDYQEFAAGPHNCVLKEISRYTPEPAFAGNPVPYGKIVFEVTVL